MPSPVPPDAARRHRVRHVTRYKYQESVELAQHVLHLEPRALPLQQSVSWSLAVSPEPSVMAQHSDSFGNPVTYLALQEPHSSLEIVSEMEVEVRRMAEDPALATPWEAISAALAASADPAARAAAAFAYASPRVPLLSALRDYAGQSFSPGRPIGEAALDLVHRIHADFVFDPVATTVSTPLAEVLERRRGVCQDLAHVVIGCLRALGLTARYVSGYIRTIPPPGQARLRGSDASHAWVALWCGGACWLDLDATNNQAATLDYATVAWGRDYDDVSPVRGVLFGGSSHTLAVMVDVESVEAGPV
jgi:transglutaminase-like putative cysteine protease